MAILRTAPRSRAFPPLSRAVLSLRPRGTLRVPSSVEPLLLPRPALDAGGELGDLGVGGPALAHQVGDLLDRVHDRRVVLAAERGTDAREGQLGQLAAQVHGDLTGVDQRAAAVA